MTNMQRPKVLLDVDNLTVRLTGARGTVHAVNGISYQLRDGETLAVVGESGSGKSVHYLSMVKLIPTPPCRIVAGSARFEDDDLVKLDRVALRPLLGKRIGIVFQDPMTSLNPVLPIGIQLTERLTEHMGLSPRQARVRAAELLDLVRIPNPAGRLDQFPHQFSGGMRQRVMIAIALSCDPKLLIADEPTTALDVTVQAQILDLVAELKQKLGMSIIWISHDLGVVAGIADTVQVMYAGMIVERGPVREVFNDPRNAYTLGLLQSIPDVVQGPKRRLRQIPGSPPNMLAPPKGDPFAPRNPFATPRCFEEVPPLRPVADGHPEHFVAAWYDLRQHRDAALEVQ